MKRIIIALIIVSMLLMTGCWDMIEIEDRTYPYSIGVDLNDTEKVGKYLFTMSYPNIAAIGKNASSDEPVFVLDDASNSLFELLHKLTTRLQRPVYLKLLNVFIVSEGFAKNNQAMRETIDGLNRDFIVSKNILMLLVKESANELLKSLKDAQRQRTIEGAINSMLINRQKSSMFVPITFMNFVEEMDISNSSMIPVAHVGEEEIVIHGGAVFKDYALIGYLEPMEVRALAVVRNDIEEDSIDVDYKGNNLSVMVTNVTSKRKLENKDNNIKIIYNVELEGHIHSFVIRKDMEVDTEEILEDLQKTIEKDIKMDIDNVIRKVQKELKVDLLKIGNFLSKYHPKMWKDIQKNWEEIYPDIEIEVNVKMFLRRRGLAT